MDVLQTSLASFIPCQQETLLSGGRVSISALEAFESDLRISGEIINAIGSPTTTCKSITSRVRQINLKGCLALPGLINAHDHLEFGIFPRLGNGPYPDAKSWAMDIYRPEGSPVSEFLRIPKATRLYWGGFKNLFSGVTTVCHHNPFEAETFQGRFPVQVLKHYRWAHSLDFTSNIGACFSRLPANSPFQIHLGEGTVERSRLEIYQFDKLGFLDNHSVLVHGVAFNAKEWELIRQRGASAIWCPSSNLFVLGQTINPVYLLNETKVALGSDSPLTAEGDLLEEIRVAAQFGLPPDRIYKMVTEIPAEIFRLHRGEGRIRTGGIANLLIVTDTGEPPAQRLLSLTHKDIQLVMTEGRFELVSDQIFRASGMDFEKTMQYVSFDGFEGWTAGDVHSCWNETIQWLGTEVKLAGKKFHG